MNNDRNNDGYTKKYEKRKNPYAGTAETPRKRQRFDATNSVCYKCGRKGHYSTRCDAKKDKDGKFMGATSDNRKYAPKDTQSVQQKAKAYTPPMKKKSDPLSKKQNFTITFDSDAVMDPHFTKAIQKFSKSYNEVTSGKGRSKVKPLSGPEKKALFRAQKVETQKHEKMYLNYMNGLEKGNENDVADILGEDRGCL